MRLVDQAAFPCDETHWLTARNAGITKRTSTALCSLRSLRLNRIRPVGGCAPRGAWPEISHAPPLPPPRHRCRPARGHPRPRQDPGPCRLAHRRPRRHRPQGRHGHHRERPHHRPRRRLHRAGRGRHGHRPEERHRFARPDGHARPHHRRAVRPGRLRRAFLPEPGGCRAPGDHLREENPARRLHDRARLRRRRQTQPVHARRDRQGLGRRPTHLRRR